MRQLQGNVHPVHLPRRLRRGHPPLPPVAGGFVPADRHAGRPRELQRGTREHEQPGEQGVLHQLERKVSCGIIYFLFIIKFIKRVNEKYLVVKSLYVGGKVLINLFKKSISLVSNRFNQ